MWKFGKSDDFEDPLKAARISGGNDGEEEAEDEERVRETAERERGAAVVKSFESTDDDEPSRLLTEFGSHPDELLGTTDGFVEIPDAALSTFDETGAESVSMDRERGTELDASELLLVVERIWAIEELKDATFQ